MAALNVSPVCRVCLRLIVACALMASFLVGFALGGCAPADTPDTTAAAPAAATSAQGASGVLAQPGKAQAAADAANAKTSGDVITP